MEDEKDNVSEAKEEAGDGEGEDLPSDFFDDFTKDDFMEGLSVVDEFWDESSAPPPKVDRISRSRINAEALDSVKDLRELIGDNPEEEKCPNPTKTAPPNSKYRWRKPDSPQSSELDNFIKPGSRRDPNKTNEAIKKDKEVKVQQFLAKTLESSDDLRPPGTELDDYYEDEKKKDIKDRTPTKEDSSSQEHFREKDVRREYVESPQRMRRGSPPRPRYSPRARRSPRSRFSPHSRHSPRMRVSPRHSHSFRHFSPPQYRPRFSAKRFSPGRKYVRQYSPRRSPGRQRRYSPQRSPRRHQRSRSPRRRTGRRSRSHSHSRSPHHEDSSHYHNNPQYPPGAVPYQGMDPQYAPEFPGVPGYPYSQMPAYANRFPAPYNYGGPPVPNMPGPPVMPNPIPAPPLNPVPTPTPAMVPAPAGPVAEKTTPYDALAQLLAEGKISQEDYLKLTPNKGVATTMDTKTRVMVLTRCNQALSKLDKLLLPNRLIMNNQMTGVDDKYIAPKYSSPLKRQAIIDFSFSKGSVTPAQQTKRLVESIISTLGLDKVVSKYRKTLPKDMRDAAVQTSRSHCEVCEIRESTKSQDVAVMTEPAYLTSSIHTQVVEQDLFSSKSIFTPSGSIGDGAPISIAHLTPAQLVSQLAARAKTLKQPNETPPQNQYSRRPPQNYDYDSRGGQQYRHPYNNYRY